jgi:hypothetical protein
MFTARKKIVKEKGAEPDDFEETVAQVCHSFILVSMAPLAWLHNVCTRLGTPAVGGCCCRP